MQYSLYINLVKHTPLIIIYIYIVRSYIALIINLSIAVEASK